VRGNRPEIKSLAIVFEQDLDRRISGGYPNLSVDYIILGRV
jgi:hypothetical protein